ncbi:hypothetical protein Tco_1120738, partial [Tanacetum coccineum]
ADLPWYILESDLEEDPKEDDDEDPEEDPADYPTNKDDDEEEEPSGDEANDEEEDEDDEDEEDKEHPTLADAVPPPPVHHTTGRISIPGQAPIPFLSEEEIPSPPLPVSPPLPISPLPLSASPTYLLGFRAAMIWLRTETPSTSHSLQSSTPPLGTPPLLPIPLPTSSPPLLLPSTDCRAGVSEVTLPPQKRLCVALGPRYEVGESSSAPTARPSGGFRADYGFVTTLDDEIRRDPERDVGFGITDTWAEMLVSMPGAPATDDTRLGRQITNFVTTIRHDTDEIYGRLDEAHDARAVLSEAKLSCEVCGRSMAASDAARYEVMVLHTIVLDQQLEIVALRAADHARHA